MPSNAPYCDCGEVKDNSNNNNNNDDDDDDATASNA